MTSSTRTPAGTLAALALAATLAACGGGGDDGAATVASGSNNAAAAGGAAAALTCNTAGYQAGTVEQPSAAQLAAYAATYNGEEGSYGPNPGDPFVKSANAVLVLASDGRITYKGVAYTPESVCIDKAAGVYGKILYVLTNRGHFDVTDTPDAQLGSAWGVSAADGTTIFTKGARQ